MADERFVSAIPARELLKDRARLDWLEGFVESTDHITFQSFLQGLRAYTGKRDTGFYPTIRELIDAAMKDGSFY